MNKAGGVDSAFLLQNDPGVVILFDAHVVS
jgi:hypothetical protein